MLRKNETRRNFLRGAGALATAVAGAGARKLHAEAERPAPSAHTWNVADFGAKGDGSTLDTGAINRTIDAAAAGGGGAVVFPPGNYLSCSIHLRSRVSLQLMAGATIIAADTRPDRPGFAYDPAEPNDPWEAYQDYGHNHWHNSLIWGENLVDIAICGSGLIWGRGLSRGEGAGPVAEQPGVANKAIGLKNCRNVVLRDFSMLHGGHDAILTTGVDNLTMDNLLIDTQRGGIDIDCCRNVHVTRCSVNSPWDDAICLKSSFALGHSRATESVTISDCYVTGIYEEGTLLDGTFRRFADDVNVDRNGRIKLGTESTGGFRNIAISNCVFEGCYGIAVISEDGAIIEDVTVSNIAMHRIIGAPVFVRLGSRMRAPAGTPMGTIRRVSFSNIVCSETGSQACSLIVGVPGHAIEELRLTGFFIRHPGGGSRQDATIRLPEMEKEYPDPLMFGTTPAHGFFVRHAQGIEMTQITIGVDAPDARPCFVLHDVHDASLTQIRFPRGSTIPLFVMEEVSQIAVWNSKPVPDTEIGEAKSREL